MPKREYIGGKDYRVKTMARIPGFTRKIWERANAYGVDPNLILHRIGKEGWVDQLVQRYNALDADEQNDAFWRNLWDEQVAGYGSFGLDYAGSNLMRGIYSLKDPNATWHEAEFDDEEGGKQFRNGTSLIADNLSSAIEILAADMAYRQGQVGKLYGKTDRDLNTWTNASFNMGLHHKDLKNDEYIQGKYTYPDYYTDFGLEYESKSLGGLISRYGYDAVANIYNSMKSGGKIHIKPENRGKFTALKERTGHSSTWFKEHGTPAQKKMATFALNAAKWNHKHADGGLLNSFDMGGDKENDALAKAIIARVNQEEAAKKLREERKMSEQSLIDEHPGLDLALIYAQPGGILSKAMAPSMAKGMVNSLVSGNTEGLLASLIPGGAQVQKLSGAVKATKPLTEAERLGVPKGLRANPKALEDPYYWGYRQWNQRYNDAVKAGDIEEAQRLRDLHFQTKAINNQLQVDGHPIPLYHGNIGSDSQLASAGYNPYSTARTAVGSSGYFAVADPQIASTYKGPSGSIKTVYGYSKNPAVYNAEGRNWQDALVKEESGHRVGVRTDAVVNSAFDSGHDAVLIDNVVDYGFYTPASHQRQPFTDYVFKPGNVKLKDAVVEDGLFFEPIPIVKRDNFHNPDIRYGDGGLLHRFDEGGEKEPWYQTLLNSMSSARDANIGAMGAQQIRDLYTQGENKLAGELAKKYTVANGVGIAGGVASGVGAGSLGTGLAKGIGWFGNTAMPSSLLKGAAYYLPDVAAEAAAMSPYLDAAALTAWTGIGYKNAKNRWKSGDKAGAIAEGAIASLPLFAAAPAAINNAKNATRGFFRVMPDNMVNSGAPAESGTDFSTATSKLYNPQEIMKRYSPKQIIRGIKNLREYKAMLGDKSNIMPGVEFAVNKYRSRADLLDRNMKLAAGLPLESSRLVKTADALNTMPDVQLTKMWKGPFVKYVGRTPMNASHIEINPYHKAFLKVAKSNPELAIRFLSGAGGAHEGTHWSLIKLGANPLSELTSTGNYFRANPYHPLFNGTTNIFSDPSRVIKAKSALQEAWMRSPEEFAAELTQAEFANGVPAIHSYPQFSGNQLQPVNEFLGARFQFNPAEVQKLIRDFSLFGYKNGGLLKKY